MHFFSRFWIYIFISAKSEQLKISECGEKIEVLFSDNKVIDSLNTKALEERDMYIDPPGLYLYLKISLF